MKKFLSVLLIFTFISSQTIASEIGNTIKKEEYPEANAVKPVNSSDTFTIEGGVSKNIDVNMQDCMKFALGNNPKIQAAIQDVFASDYRIKQAWSNWFPSVSWQTGYTHMKQLQISSMFNRNITFDYYLLGSISLSEMLYDFGVTQNTVTIKKLENQQYKMILTETINTVLRDVKNSYNYVLLALEQEKVAQETVEQYENFYNQAKAFYEAGMNPKVDVTISEVNLSNAKLTLIQAQNAVDIAMAKLNNTMGLPYMNRYNILEELKYNPCDITLDKSISIARNARPDFRLSEVKVQTANQNVKLAKKAWYPKLQIQGDFQIGGRSWDQTHGYTIGGNLAFPVVNGMLIRNKIRETQNIHSREVAKSKQAQNDIYLEIQNAYYTLLEKKNKIPVSTLQVKQAKENYDLSFGRYKVGVGNPVELKEAQVQYANSKMQYNNTLYEFNAARADLEKAIGKNIIAGSVDLKVEDISNKKDDNTAVDSKTKSLESVKPSDTNEKANDKNLKEVKSQKTKATSKKAASNKNTTKKVNKKSVKAKKVQEESFFKPVIRTRNYKNKFIKSIHNYFSFSDDK